jgi:hypothetical protein
VTGGPPAGPGPTRHPPEELAALTDRLAELAARLDAVESVLAIQALKARYGDLTDARFERGAPVAASRRAAIGAAIAELFTEDGVWDGGRALGVARGRVEIAERLATSVLDFSRHLFVKPRIDVAPGADEAVGRWDLLAPCREAAGASYWMVGEEQDEYRRVDGVWLHHSMHLTTIAFTPVGEPWGRILA